MFPSFRARLGPIKKYLDDADVTEIAINQPGQVWLRVRGYGYMKCVELPEYTYSLLESLMELVANYSKQATSEMQPVLSATIPVDLNPEEDQNVKLDGYRVQFIRPPATERGTIAANIRKFSLTEISIADLDGRGYYERVNLGQAARQRSDDELRELYRSRQWGAFLRAAVKARKTIVISADTDTGKTTQLNALLKEIPMHERIVTIEDAREVRPPQPNCVHLLYSQGGQGVARISEVELFRACLRLTPNRIILGELRGKEAYTFVQNVYSGHPGSMTTIHAKSPEEMWKRLAGLVQMGNDNLSFDQALRLCQDAIDIVLQLEYDRDRDERFAGEIYYADAS